MTLFKYIFRSLVYFKKQNLAVFLGTVLSAAILTGALVVGDSVHYSLNQLVQKRLGNITYAMQTGDRFVGNDLSFRIQEALKVNTAGVLQLNGMVVNPDQDIRVNQVNILGIDSLFWKLGNQQIPEPGSDQVYLSNEMAERLKVSVGDEILIRMHNVDAIPVNAPFAQEKSPSVSFRLRVEKIIGDENLGRFSLKSDQKTPHNIWVSKSLLWKHLDLKNKVNVVLVSDLNNQFNSGELQQRLAQIWNLDDAGLKLNKLDNENQFELTADRIFIDKSVGAAFENSANPVITYLVNGIQFDDKETPYSFVSGISDEMLGQKLKPNEVILNSWCADDLGVKTGDSVTFKYFVIGPYRKLEVQQSRFVVQRIEPNQSGLFKPDLMPDFPGLSDAQSCSQWETGVPIDLDKIRDKDEDYWNKFRGTPKALINLDEATKIWGNAFGDYTAIRFQADNTNKDQLANNILSKINPGDLGLQFTNVKAEAEKSAKNSVDFGELFLSLSFFVIAAAIILLVLAHTLNVLSRKSEIGVLKALGFNRKKIVRIFLMESILPIVTGSIAGAFLGILYNILIMKGLNTLWIDAVRTHALEVLVIPTTFVNGIISSIIIAGLSVYLVIRKQVKLSLLENIRHGLGKNRSKLMIWFSLVSYFVGLLLVGYSIATHQVQNADLFLSAGAMILIAMVLHFGYIIKKGSKSDKKAGLNVHKLISKNLGMQLTRSLSAIILLALGTFSVMITGANRKTFYGTNEQRQSGTGGFLFWVENSLPISVDLNSTIGKEKFSLADETFTDSIHFFQMYTLSGDDASCLNLNQVQRPRILGIDDQYLDENKAFSFMGLKDGISAESPWGALDTTYAENTIPAYLDQTVITWGLMKKIGDTLNYTDEEGKKLNLIIAGGLNSSVFQGNILISEQNFLKYFPSSAQSKVMMVDAQPEYRQKIIDMLDFNFRDYGVDYELTTQRLAEFNSVTNTYLDVFMILGGLGIALGALGFGIIVLRNKLERRREYALYQALGFKPRKISGIIFYEHVTILVAGMVIGVISSFIGMLPSILSPSFEIPVLWVIGLILLITISGLFWIVLAAYTSGKKNLVSALRVE